jgi:hypothetical protein
MDENDVTVFAVPVGDERRSSQGIRGAKTTIRISLRRRTREGVAKPFPSDNLAGGRGRYPL